MFNSFSIVLSYYLQLKPLQTMNKTMHLTVLFSTVLVLCTAFSSVSSLPENKAKYQQIQSFEAVPCLIYISPQTHRLTNNKTMVNYYWTTNNNSCFYAVTKQYSVNGGVWQSSTASPVSPVIFNGVPCTINVSVRVIGHYRSLNMDGSFSHYTTTSGVLQLPPCW